MSKSPAVIAVTEDDVKEHNHVLYGLVHYNVYGELANTDPCMVNCISWGGQLTITQPSELEGFKADLLRRPFILRPLVTVRRSTSIITSKLFEERWLLMVNQLHTCVQENIDVNFSMARYKMTEGKPFVLELSFNQFIERVYQTCLCEPSIQRKVKSVAVGGANISVYYPGKQGSVYKSNTTSEVTFRYNFNELGPQHILRRTISLAKTECDDPCKLNVDPDKVKHCLPGWDFSYIAVDRTPRLMGNGVVKLETGPNGIHLSRSPRGSARSSRAVQCEGCACRFTLPVKQVGCKDCGRTFCSNCTVRSGQTHQCKKCCVIVSGTCTKERLSQFKVKDLKAPLLHQNVNLSRCTEKEDLIELIVRHYGSSSNTFSNSQGSSNQSRQNGTPQSNPGSARSSGQPEPTIPGSIPDQQNTTLNNFLTDLSHLISNAASSVHTGISQAGATTTNNPTNNGPNPHHNPTNNQPRQPQPQAQTTDRNEPSGANAQPKPSSEADGKKMKLDDIKNEEEIDNMNIKEIKRVLLNNFVDFKGCVERWELQERLKRLWRDNEANKKKAEEQRKISEDPSMATSTATTGEDDTCKICMDATIDCVLLECGHMVSCTKCGKQLSECPICRQFVVRAVHTFKA